MLKTVLCMDIGTTSLKAGLISAAGEVVFLCRKSFKEPDSRFIALEWLDAVKSCVEALREQKYYCKLDESRGGVDRGCGNMDESRGGVDHNRGGVGDGEIRICGICVSGAGPTVVLQNGLTFRWNEKIPEKIKLPESVGFSLFLPEMLTLKQDFSLDWNKSDFAVSGPEFLIYQLTGNRVTILPEKRYSQAYWSDFALEECGFGQEKQKFPSFTGIGSCAGSVLKSVKQQLGICDFELPDDEPAAGETSKFAGNAASGGKAFGKITFAEDLKVFCGAPDFIVALIGTNTLKDGKLCDRAGSSEGFNFCTSKHFFTPQTRTLPSVIPGLWNVSALSAESGRIFVEFKHKLEKEQHKTIEYSTLIRQAFEEKNSLASKVINQILEQVKNSVAVLRKALAEQGIEFPKTMTVTGGQAKNDLWMQKKADALGIILEVCNCADSELTGDACAAWFGLGEYDSIQAAAENIVKVTKRFIPHENI